MAGIADVVQKATPDDAEKIQERQDVWQSALALMGYVSGYLASEIASASHAWVEVFVPATGWLGLDPTHNCQTGENYVKIGVGRDYGDVPPVAGSYRGTLNRRMEVEVKITPAT